jgi:hypothetical protein
MALLLCTVISQDRFDLKAMTLIKGQHPVVKNVSGGFLMLARVQLAKG